MPGSNVEEKLDIIINHMERLDRRDRIRTYGGFVKGLLALIPLALFLWSGWYVYKHSDEFLERITKSAANQAMQMSGFKKK
jgi:hypothetical protein